MGTRWGTSARPRPSMVAGCASRSRGRGRPAVGAVSRARRRARPQPHVAGRHVGTGDARQGGGDVERGDVGEAARDERVPSLLGPGPTRGVEVVDDVGPDRGQPGEGASQLGQSVARELRTLSAAQTDGGHSLRCSGPHRRLAVDEVEHECERGRALPEQSEGAVEPVPVRLAALLRPAVLRLTAFDAFDRWPRCRPTLGSEMRAYPRGRLR